MNVKTEKNTYRRYFSAPLFQKTAGKSKTELLKLLAIVTMAVDHIGYVGFPEEPMFRIIGRLSLPIFCFLIAQGYIHTSNFKKYAWRLFLFIPLSQLPYMYYFGKTDLNIFATLFTGLLAVYFYENKNRIGLFASIAASLIVPMDYGLYGVLLIIFFYMLQKGKISGGLFLGLFFLATLAGAFRSAFPVQIFALIAPLVIYLIPDRNYKIRLPKYFYYVFYPAHLIILSLIFK